MNSSAAYLVMEIVSLVMKIVETSLAPNRLHRVLVYRYYYDVLENGNRMVYQ